MYEICGVSFSFSARGQRCPENALKAAIAVRSGSAVVIQDPPAVRIAPNPDPWPWDDLHASLAVFGRAAVLVLGRVTPLLWLQSCSGKQNVVRVLFPVKSSRACVGDHSGLKSDRSAFLHLTDAVAGMGEPQISKFVMSPAGSCVC